MAITRNSRYKSKLEIRQNIFSMVSWPQIPSFSVAIFQAIIPLVHLAHLFGITEA